MSSNKRPSLKVPVEGETNDPMAEIARERDLARRANDPNVNVCYLATVAVSAAGPSAEVRPLTLRDITSFGVGIVINRTSHKWAELTRDAGRAGEGFGRGASLLLHWPSVRRQYRLRGYFEETMPSGELARYWNRKNHRSRLLEHFYGAVAPQSAEITSRQVLLDGVASLEKRYPTEESVPVPAGLAGIILVPREVETWHCSPRDRLHDRHIFRRGPTGWVSRVLVP